MPLPWSHRTSVFLNAFGCEQHSPGGTKSYCSGIYPAKLASVSNSEGRVKKYIVSSSGKGVEGKS